jgi:carbamoyltransferase
MLILGIHDGHNSGATLLRDGHIAASISEERLSRTKNDVGYPRRSIDEVLRIAGASGADLDGIVYASNFMHTADHLRKAVEWYRVGKQDQDKDKLQSPAYLKAVFDTRRRERIEQVVAHLGGKPDRVSFVDHHTAHAAAAYFGSHFSFDQPVLVLTCDGAGDGLSATVSTARGAALTRIASTRRDASLGKLYSRITYLLGLTPWEHEYKVMGLAPYAEPKRALALRDVFRELVSVGDDGLTFKVTGDLEASYTYFHLRERLERVRFDEMAGGIQAYTEEMLCEWVRNCVRSTGIGRVACGGGVFMNVKANLRIAELEEVEDLFVFPSCGDESLSFGAAWLEYYTRAGKAGRAEKVPFTHAYLGPEYGDAEITRSIDAHLRNSGCTVERVADVEDVVARRVADNKAVARFAGRMEWGARALGNRSILANAREWRNVEKINSMIKMRDFWMPFAPSMMRDRQSRYLKNPKNLRSPYMMQAFETTPLAAEHLGAATHPRDRTARAQLVEPGQNERYYRLLQRFEEHSGASGLLNTSFNLHGYPLVCSPDDAIDVFLRSGLDCLALEEHIVTKPDAAR